MTTLTGTELVTIYPQRANSPNGTPTAAEAQATTQAIANLATETAAGTLVGDVVGVNNNGTIDTTVESIGGESISLGGPVAFEGAFPWVGNVTAATDVTFPAGTNTLQSTALPSGDIWVGNGSGVAAPVAMSGDATISNTGSVSVGKIGGEAVSLAGPLTELGAFPVTITATGTTNVTLPTTGTLGTGTMSDWIEGAGFTNSGGTITQGGTAAVKWQGALVNTLDASIAINSGTIEVSALPGINTLVFNNGVTGTSSGGTLTVAAATGVPLGPSWQYGDGSDGNVTVSTSISLSRDMFYQNLTLASGGTISTNAFRIFVAGTLNISAAGAGAISANGSAGGTGNNGSINGGGGGAGNGGSQNGANNIGGNTNGGTGGVGSTTVGSNGVAPNLGTANNGGAGLAGGIGGATTANATPSTGGAPPTPTLYGTMWPSAPIGVRYTTAASVIGGGEGGNSGGGGNGNGTNGGGQGGGGGSGGAVMSVVANVIARGTNSTAGIFTAKGGAAGGGGNGYSSGTGGGGGGGSGGAGGWIILAYGLLTGSTITGAIDISGGAGGSGGTGFGSGSLGGAGGGSGGSGTLYVYNLGAGTLTTTASVVGTAGSTTATATGGTGASANTKQVNL